MMYKSPTVFYTMMMMIITSFVLLCGSGGLSASKHEDNIGIYELNNGHFSVKLSNWGATIISLLLPDKNGTLHTHILDSPFYVWKFADVVLGYDSVETYKISE
ncbi:hypothetical protein Hanom_Chr06g00557471 [Helianthus anomalus]